MYEFSRQGQRVHDALAIDVSMAASLPSGSDDITEEVFQRSFMDEELSDVEMGEYLFGDISMSILDKTSVSCVKGV